VEGRCQAYTIEIERKVLSKLNSVLMENEAMKEEIYLKLEFHRSEQELVARALQDERLKVDAKLA